MFCANSGLGLGSGDGIRRNGVLVELLEMGLKTNSGDSNSSLQALMTSVILFCARNLDGVCADPLVLRERRGHSWSELQILKEVLDLREVQQAFCDDGTALA